MNGQDGLTGESTALVATEADIPAAEAQAASAPPPAVDPVPWPKPFASWYAVWLIAFVAVLSSIDRSVIALLVKPIKADLHMSDTEISLLIGVAFSVVYTIAGFPISRLIDRGNRKAIMASALTIWSLATAACGVAGSFFSLAIARGVVGGGESVKGPVSMSLIADLVRRDKFPRAYSIFSLGIAGGQAAALVVGGLLLAYFTGITPLSIPVFGELHAWQLVFMGVSIPGLLVALLIYLTVPEPARHGRISKTGKGGVPLGDVLRFAWTNRRAYAPLLTGLALVALPLYGFDAWRPSFFERTFGWGAAETGSILGVAGLIASMAGLFVGTALSEWLDRRGHADAMMRSVLYAQIFSLPMVIFGPLIPNEWGALVVTMLGVAGYWLGSPGQNAALLIITPNEMRAQIAAVYLFLLSAVGGSVGPTFVAMITDYVLRDESQLRYAMALMAAIVYPLAIFCVWVSMKPYAAMVRQANARESSGN